MLCFSVCVWQAFGWCPNGAQCQLSHDTDLIVLQDDKGLRDKRKRRKRKREKGGGDKAAEGSSVFDGAPENKLTHMEVEVEGTPDEQQRSEPNNEPPMDGDQNPQQNERENMKTDSEGNRMCEENTDFKKSATTSTSEDDGRTELGKLIDQSNTVDQKKADTGTHRAGFDAFMTGYIFSYSCTLIKKEGVGGVEEEEQSCLPACLNKVYLSGKAAPLNVVKSTFSKSSKAHVQKMQMVWGERL